MQVNWWTHNDGRRVEDVWRMCVVVCCCFLEEATSVARLEKVSVTKRAVKARSYLNGSLPSNGSVK
jgi:hypothetical protein